MTENLRLGRIAGVTVGINWTVLVVFLLVTTGLAAGRFPARFPEENPAAYAVAGLAAGVVFFLSLLAHEIAHAVVARRHGIEVDGITLWLFGGVARLKGEARTPSAELAIAGVGPLVSLVLAAAFAGVAVGLAAAGAPGLAVDAVQWLAVINLVLAVFNLVPAAPLDGGRVLRALLWRWRGDRTAAAVTASRAGRVFGWVLVALGFVQVVIVGFGGLWLVLIGWFIAMAARAEEQHSRVSGALTDVRVRDVMTPDPTTVPPGLTVDRFVSDVVFRHRHSTFPVVDGDGRPVGLVTLRRVKEVAPAERATTLVDRLACPPEEIPLARPDDALVDLLPRMAGCTDGRALVVDEAGRLVGLVSPTDVTRRLELGDLRATGKHHM
jgi:Zn-dependent protease